MTQTVTQTETNVVCPTKTTDMMQVLTHTVTETEILLDFDFMTLYNSRMSFLAKARTARSLRITETGL